MKGTVLVTGGGGFIGSHVAARLLSAGYHVRVLDSLIPQVHGDVPRRPEYLHRDAELLVGDIRNPEVLDEALNGVEAVYHFVALVGVGQSMYQISEYTSVNNGGTAALLEKLARQPVNKLIVASSMSIYGEGLCKAQDGTPYLNAYRTADQLKSHRWELSTPDGEPLTPIPTPESKPPSLASVYALQKYDQEQMCLMVGRAYGIPTVALRFFNAYGPYQSLSNPYTGVLAIFASRLMNGERPILFEDGEQIRDFVSVYDIAQACQLALEREDAKDVVVNVGSGEPITVCEVAQRLGKVLGRNLEPNVVSKYRVGDIRHCFPDISLAKSRLGFRPEVALQDGMSDLAAWLEQQTADDRFHEMQNELASRGLVV